MGLVLINYHGLMLGKYEEMNAKGFTIYRVELLCMCVVQKKITMHVWRTVWVLRSADLLRRLESNLKANRAWEVENIHSHIFPHILGTRWI